MLLATTLHSYFNTGGNYLDQIKVIAWNINMLKTEEKRLAIETIIRNSIADIVILSEFPSNEIGSKLLDSLKSEYSYILPTRKEKKAPTKFFPIEEGQVIKVGYEVPPYKDEGWMITIVLIRKDNENLRGFKIKDIENNECFLMNKEFRWLELEASLWGEKITLIGVHIPEHGKGGENYWKYLKSHLSKIEHKVIVIGDMNVVTELPNGKSLSPWQIHECRRIFMDIQDTLEFKDLAKDKGNTEITHIHSIFEAERRIDYVLLSQSFFDENTVITYIHDDSDDNFRNSDHVNIGVTVQRHESECDVLKTV